MTSADRLAQALERLLAAHEAEAKAHATAQVASENYSRRSAKSDEAAHLKAMLDASAAEKHARETLAAWEAEKAQAAKPVAYLLCGDEYENELQDWEFEPEQGVCDRLNEAYFARGVQARLPVYLSAAPQPEAAKP